jgi:hypothetical protein
MKHILLFSIALFLSVISFAQTIEGGKSGPVITFAEKSHDFGDIAQGEKIEYVFKFQNTGTQPLVISDVITTCQCTAKQWSKTPVMPGKSGQITISFDSAGKMGIQNKVVTVQSNATNSTERVSIRVNVLPPTNK